MSLYHNDNNNIYMNHLQSPKAYNMENVHESKTKKKKFTKQINYYDANISKQFWIR